MVCSLRIIIIFANFYRNFWTTKTFSSRGCRHGSVDSSEPSHLLPWVRFQSTPTIILSIYIWIVSCGKDENKPKRDRDWPIFKKNFSSRGAAMAQWIRMCLLSWRPGFESQAHHLSIYIVPCVKDENKQKVAGICPFIWNRFAAVNLTFKGHCCGRVVSKLAFYSDNSSSNPTEAYILMVKCCFE